MIYTTRTWTTWDAIAKETLGDEFKFDLIMELQPQEILRDYTFLIAPNVSLNIPDRLTEANTKIFRAPWSDDED